MAAPASSPPAPSRTTASWTTGGREYRICGKYALADVNGERYIEVQYFPNQVGSMGGLGQFQRIKDSDLKDDYELVLLFSGRARRPHHQLQHRRFRRPGR